MFSSTNHLSSSSSVEYHGMNTSKMMSKLTTTAVVNYYNKLNHQWHRMSFPSTWRRQKWTVTHLGYQRGVAGRDPGCRWSSRVRRRLLWPWPWSRNGALRGFKYKWNGIFCSQGRGDCWLGQERVYWKCQTGAFSMGRGATLTLV